jgi:hypothetical protein
MSRSRHAGSHVNDMQKMTLDLRTKATCKLSDNYHGAEVRVYFLKGYRQGCICENLSEKGLKSKKFGRAGLCGSIAFLLDERRPLSCAGQGPIPAIRVITPSVQAARTSTGIAVSKQSARHNIAVVTCVLPSERKLHCILPFYYKIFHFFPL